MSRERWLLWLALSLPALWIGWQWIATPETYGFGHAVKDSGDWAAWLLLATLAVTPLRLAFRKSTWTLWLMKRRRDLGVASFAYAAIHTAIYLVNKADLGAKRRVFQMLRLGQGGGKRLRLWVQQTARGTVIGKGLPRTSSGKTYQQ